MRPFIKSSIVLAVFLAVACGGDARQRPTGAPPGDPLRDVEASALHERGLVLADRGDYVRAEQYLTAAMSRGAPEAEILPALIRVCVASSRFNAALRHAEPYLQRHPAAWSLRYLVASLHLGLGDVERARVELERVVADAPDQPDAYYRLGLILRDEIGDRPAAAQRFASYLELAPRGEHVAEVEAALKSLAATPLPTPLPSPEIDPAPAAEAPAPGEPPPAAAAGEASTPDGAAPSRLEGSP